MAFRGLPSDRLTYGHFEATGRQDCGNVYNSDEFIDEWRKHPELDAAAIVDRVWKGWEDGDDLEAHWLQQQGGDFEGLDPKKCYEFWRDGWKYCARRQLASDIKDAKERAEEERLADEEWERSRKPRGNPGARRRNEELDDEDVHAEVLDGMARAIWVTSWANWVEELPMAQRRELRPGPGRDWDDAAPETPRSAKDAAAAMCKTIRAANDKGIGNLLAMALEADVRRATRSQHAALERIFGRLSMTHLTDQYANAFGHALAMQSLDTGVTWFDDHVRFELKVPKTQAWTTDGETIDWSPRSMANPPRRRR